MWWFKKKKNLIWISILKTDPIQIIISEHPPKDEEAFRKQRPICCNLSKEDVVINTKQEIHIVDKVMDRNTKVEITMSR